MTLLGTLVCFATAFAALLVVQLVVRSHARRQQREAEYLHRLEQQVQDRTAELARRNEDLERLNRKLEDASLTDSLTGLSNRRFLTAQMPQDVAVVDRYYRRLDSGGAVPLPGNRPDLALMMIDLDGLKRINDHYGHAAGDRALLQVCEVLKRACRKSDTVARWGGDEFLVVARGVEGEVVELLAERIRKAVAEHEVEVSPGRSVRLGCSIGFALYPFLPSAPSHLSWEQVGTIADRALYAAKSSGRNAWVGLFGTPRTPLEDTISLINQGPAELVEEDALRVSSSLDDRAALVWERRVVSRESESLVSGPHR